VNKITVTISQKGDKRRMDSIEAFFDGISVIAELEDAE